MDPRARLETAFGLLVPEMSNSLFECYVAIEAASSQMLEAAKLADWNEVVRYEGACAVLIEQLRHCAQHEEMTPAQRREKVRIMQQILRNDAQVRLLTEPWVSELDKILDPKASILMH